MKNKHKNIFKKKMVCPFFLKSFTMLGTAKNPGLIPRGCEEIFRRIERDYSQGDTQVKFYFIYVCIYLLLEKNLIFYLY